VDQRDELLRDQRLNPSDFQRAARATQFDAFRRGRVDHFAADADAARIEPVFADGDSATPRTRGFCVVTPLPNGGEHVRDFGMGYFGSLANRVRAEFVRTEVMRKEDELFYRLTAYLDDEPEVMPKRKFPLSLEPVSTNVAVHGGCRRDFGPPDVWDQPDYADIPVLIERGVLEEAVAEAEADAAREIGGFLLGRLLRDEKNHEIFVTVTGLASGCGTTEASETSVTFTPRTFARVRQIIGLRGADESIVGWYHSHPFRFCAECPLPTPPECVAKVLFYSQDDIHLMETTFDQPFMVGLLAAVEPRLETVLGHLPVKLYGWRDGEIKARGFDVVDRPADVVPK
jgi:proteasome lid subunit RPN8/RPN11